MPPELNCPVPKSIPVGGFDPPVASEPQTRRARGTWSALGSMVPNALAFALLAGVFVLGHRTDWKLGKLSDLTSSKATAADDWCVQHLVPESQCVECQPKLFPRPKPFGFCRKHGVAECVIDHPELAQVEGPPRLPRYDTASAIEVLPRSPNNRRNMLHERLVQFASAEAATKAGVDVDVVTERAMSDAVIANGELTFDPTRVAHLASRVPGTILVVFKALGEIVEPGDILALVDAAAIGQAKSALVHAAVQRQLRRTTLERMQKAASSLAGRTVIEAEAACQEAEVAFSLARQNLLNLGLPVPESFETTDLVRLGDGLRFLGLSPATIERLPPGTQTSNLYPIQAPYRGMVVAADVVSGEVVETSRTLFTVSDPRRLWLMLSVRQEDARFIKVGLPVEFKTDDLVHEISGTVGWISPAIDEQTRTLQVRIEVENPEGHLRDKTFGTGRIVLRREPHAIVVPRDAVQSTPDAHFVFVRDHRYLQDGAPKVFHVRQVRLGARDDEYVELLAGVLPGEIVATKGSGALLAQLLRSQLGAGCGCHDH